MNSLQFQNGISTPEKGFGDIHGDIKVVHFRKWNLGRAAAGRLQSVK